MARLDDILNQLQAKIGPIPSTIAAELKGFADEEDRDILRDDLPRCNSLAEVLSLISYLRGKEDGRLEGLRRAFYAVLGSRDDESAEELEKKAFESTDPDELEELLLLAASSIGLTSMN